MDLLGKRLLARGSLAFFDFHIIRAVCDATISFSGQRSAFSNTDFEDTLSLRAVFVMVRATDLIELCAKSLSVKNWLVKIGSWGKEAFDCELCEKRFNLIVWHKQCSSITPRGWWHGEKICISHHTSVKITLTFCTYLYTAKLGQDVCCLTNNNNVLAKDQYPVYFRGFQLDDCVFQSGLNFENFQGRNLRNFWWAFWEKRWPHKFILNLTDLY